MRVRTRLAQLIVGLLLAFGAVVAIFVPQQVEKAARAALVGELASLHQLASSLVGPALVFSDLETVKSTSSLILENPNVAFVTILDEYGDPVFSQAKEGEENKLTQWSAGAASDSISSIIVQSADVETDLGSAGQLTIAFSDASARRSATNSRKRAIIASVTFVILGLFIASVIAFGLVAPLTQLNRAFGDLSRGTIAHDIPETGANELMSLAKAFNETKRKLADVFMRTARATRNLGKSVTIVEKEAHSMENAASLLGRNVAEVGTSVEEIASQIQRVVDTTETLASNVLSTSVELDGVQTNAQEMRKAASVLREEVGTFSNTVGDVLTSIEVSGKRVNDWQGDAQNISTTAQNSHSSIDQIVTQVDDTLNILSNLQSEIETLGGEIGDISNVVGSMQSVSDRTHILALNASIEAARAGQAGKGFSVVAAEIRKLSLQSVASMRRIEQTVERVQLGHQDLDAKVELRVEQVSAGMAGVRSAAEKLSDLVIQVQGVVDLAAELSGSSLKQAEGINKINTYIQAVQTFAEEVYSRSETQFSQSAKVSQTMDQLVQLSSDIRHATAEQYNGGQLILKSVQSIDQTAQQTSATATALARTVEDLVAEQRALQESASFFSDANGEATVDISVDENLN